MLHFSQLKNIVKGQQLSVYKDAPVTYLIIDSRKAIIHEGSVFFAIAGEHHNGHAYIDSLYKAGLCQFVIERDVDITQFSEANFLKVESTVQTLQKIASDHRQQFSMPVIGITGSNGKTIVKEWLYQLCSREYNIVKNPGSYNSQLGVPLSVWQMQPHHQLGIFEAGISKPGEMEKLTQIIQPTVGVFTTIGTAHNENFTNTNEKIDEKLKLFDKVDVLIYCNDHKEIHDAVVKKKIPALSWGFSPEANVQIEKKGTDYLIISGAHSFTVSFPFSDKASVENAFHCITVMLHLGYDTGAIQQRIKQLRSVAMRLELKEGIHQCQIIDDTYNNDLGGLQISLDFLANQNQKQQKSLILSDILQSGLPEKELVARIAQLTNSLGLKSFIGIGKELKNYASEFTGNAQFYASTEEFLQQADLEIFQNEVILIKGARVFQFENIIARMVEKVHGTVMEVDLGALSFNLNFFRSKLKPTTKLMVMVKAFAYGSGSVEVANVLQYHRVDYLGVAYADEGVELRRNNISLPIMVMNPAEEGFASITSYNLEPEIYSFKILNSYLGFLNGRKANIHIKLNTGMNRLGFDEGDVAQLIAILRDSENVHVASIFSHLAGSDDAEHDAYSHQQATVFNKNAKKISTALKYKPILHLLNTSGILRLPELQLDMIRLGIGLYGVDPISPASELKQVATLKTVVSQVREIKKGETIGYGRAGKAINNMTIATIAIGYADGYNRAFSKGVGEVWVKEKRVPVVGNVCMDMTMIDVTGLDVQEGDEVIIFGRELSIYEVASKIKTIPYEILTNTSERVRRVFVAEGI